MSFPTEAKLFQQAFESPFIKNVVEALIYPTVAYIEPKGFFGIPDLVVANLSNSDIKLEVFRTFAFEMKLSNWKRALVQAYRYRAFVNFSFVVLDRCNIKPALIHIDQFVLSNIGLISIDSTGFMSLHYFPNHDDPYSMSLKQKLENMILQQDILHAKKWLKKPITEPLNLTTFNCAPILM